MGDAYKRHTKRLLAWAAPKGYADEFLRLIASKWWKPFQEDLGTTHGVGILLLVAKLDTGGTGTLRPEEEPLS